ncbi:MAG: hypothetical protein ABEH86_05150 [Haloarcula sp.]
MGLKCSVLGHKYGETTVEREREEQGSEVVITIQERETCERCGNTRIISENKEITAIETPSEIAGDLVEEESAPESEAAETGQADVDRVESVSASDDEVDDSDGWDSVDDPVGHEPTDAEVDVGVDDDSYEEPVDPSADDAEIIDDSDKDESGDVELDEPTMAVDVADAESGEPVTEDETDPDKDDGLILGEEDDEKTISDERQPGEWPEEPGDDGDDWSPETMPVDNGADDVSDSESTGENTVTVPEGKFRCPECGFTTDVESTSLRAGDFCPECHRGSLINRRDE